MSDFATLISRLEAGSTDLQSCLASYPELSAEERIQLILVDQRVRFRQGMPCDLEYYFERLPWLAGDSDHQPKIALHDFGLRLGSEKSDKLLHDFEERYSGWGGEFVRQLRATVETWNKGLLSGVALETLCDKFEEAIAEKQSPTIEDWLQCVPAASCQELLRELLLIETYHLARSGSILDWGMYSRRFPTYLDLIDQVRRQHEKQFAGVFNSPPLPKAMPSPVHARDLSGSFVSRHTVGDLRNGRYRLVRKLGQGAYGTVYLAQDMDLKRQVAVKVPSREALEDLVDVDSYLVEAQNAAALDHPHIVSVYDVGRTLDGSIYIISRFIEGCPLSEWLEGNTFDYHKIAGILTKVAEALHHAHQKRFIHRDIKPANILIEESSGFPFVADFGLAIREEDYLHDGRIAGSPAYMSPEQILGEGHRLDGRSDLFSLGVVMYLMLTGRLPFPGKAVEEIAHEITTLEPTAPREIQGKIPKELERICLKLLRKRASERYQSGKELSSDLLNWLTPSTATAVEKSLQKITPRGLRSFTAEDAGFFLDLLPGPRNKDGIPESITFWKYKIEEVDPHETFAVGLLYGPSGCGKSSLVKAGVIPSLAPDVITIYIEATPNDTESRLLRQLRKRITTLPAELSLTECLERIRRSEGPKVVLFIDQFEQWLYSHCVDQDEELTRALRQCDGGRLQSILMIRDDFYLAAARLMNHIDVPIVTDKNFKLVDLFDHEHAKKILIRLGQAYNRLPACTTAISAEQNLFVNQVIAGLSEGKKIVSVRLSLLADMLKGRDWSPATLNSIGGLAGLGINFLEETFASNRADARHRAHQHAVRGVLRTLLPDTGTDIRGSMRPENELLESSGYVNRRQDFQDLLSILDSELRLLTPTDPEGYDSQSNSDFQPRRYYQLTHDYLVPSLREWLTRKQRETMRGRAELKLVERTAAWKARSEAKQLPSFWEWIQILLWTKPQKWLADETSLMKKARNTHLCRIGGLIGVLCLTGIAYSGITRQAEFQQELHQSMSDLVNLSTSKQRLEELFITFKDQKYRKALLAKLISADISDDAKLRLIIALSQTDPVYRAIAYERLGNASPKYISLIIDVIEREDPTILDDLNNRIVMAEAQGASRTQLGLLTGLSRSTYRTDRNEKSNAQRVLELLKEINDLEIEDWLTALSNDAEDFIALVRSDLETSAQLIPDRIRNRLIRKFASHDSELVYQAITVSSFEEVGVLASCINSENQALIDRLKKLLNSRILTDSTDVHTQPMVDQEDARNDASKRRTLVALSLLRIKRFDDVWHAIIHQSEHVTSLLIENLHLTDLSMSDLFDEFNRTNETKIKYLILCGLWCFPVEKKDFREQQILDSLEVVRQTTNDTGIRWACYSILRKRRKVEIEQDPPMPYSHLRNWMTSSTGVSLSLVRGPLIATVGQSQFEWNAQPTSETKQRRVYLPHSFAIGNFEVTMESFLDCVKDCGIYMHDGYKPELGWSSRTFDSPVTSINYYDAAIYCRWLTKKEGFPESEQCYPEFERIKPGMVLREDFQTKKGYRLPTVAEWEIAHRAGSTTPCFYGEKQSLSVNYAWSATNSFQRTQPVGHLLPNPLGLFDTHGNAFEFTASLFKPADTSISRNTVLLDDTALGVFSSTANILVKGGEFVTPPKNLSSGRQTAVPTLHSWPGSGFRIVRTIDYPEEYSILSTHLGSEVEYWTNSSLLSSDISATNCKATVEPLVNGSKIIVARDNPLGNNLTYKLEVNQGKGKKTQLSGEFYSANLTWEAFPILEYATRMGDIRFPSNWRNITSGASLGKGNARVTELGSVFQKLKEERVDVGFALSAVGELDVMGGAYEFASGPCPVRILVDGELAIDTWPNSSLNSDLETLRLAPGLHSIKIEAFCENSNQSLEIEIRPSQLGENHDLKGQLQPN